MAAAVLITTEGWCSSSAGTGTIIYSGPQTGTYVLTSGHVVSSGSGLKVHVPNSLLAVEPHAGITAYPAEVVDSEDALDPEADLATQARAGTAIDLAILRLETNHQFSRTAISPDSLPLSSQQAEALVGSYVPGQGITLDHLRLYLVESAAPGLVMSVSKSGLWQKDTRQGMSGSGIVQGGSLTGVLSFAGRRAEVRVGGESIGERTVGWAIHASEIRKWLVSKDLGFLAPALQESETR